MSFFEELRDLTTPNRYGDKGYRKPERGFNNTSSIYKPHDLAIIRIDERERKVETLKIQTVPKELDYNPQANWVVIPSVGRNNPFYNYTGGEDSLSFTLDWFCNDERRTDVIESCRWLESLSKADGYNAEPPMVILQWGRLFRFEKWIVESAPYKLSLFNREYSMLPGQAYQEVTLKRVTGFNLGIKDMRRVWGSKGERTNDTSRFY